MRKKRNKKKSMHFSDWPDVKFQKIDLFCGGECWLGVQCSAHTLGPRCSELEGFADVESTLSLAGLHPLCRGPKNWPLLRVNRLSISSSHDQMFLSNLLCLGIISKLKPRDFNAAWISWFTVCGFQQDLFPGSTYTCMYQERAAQVGACNCNRSP